MFKTKISIAVLAAAMVLPYVSFAQAAVALPSESQSIISANPCAISPGSNIFCNPLRTLAIPTSSTILASSTNYQSFVASLQAEIQNLLAQVKNLEAQLPQGSQSGNASSSAVEGSSSMEATSSASGNGGGWCYNFASNLGPGTTGSGVTALQAALQAQGISVSSTGTFDAQTESAVNNFQEMHAGQILTPSGLQSGTGFVGKATRTLLNTIYGCSGGNPPVINPMPISPTLGSTTWIGLPCFAGPSSSMACPPKAWPVSSSTTSTPPIMCPAWGCKGPIPTPICCKPIGVTSTTPIACPEVVGVGGQTGNCPPLPKNPIWGSSSTPPIVCPQPEAGTSLSGRCYYPMPTPPTAVSTTPVTGPITLSALSPASGAVGTQVTITGTDFSTTTNTIYFGDGDVASVGSLNGTTLSFQVPQSVSPCYAPGVVTSGATVCNMSAQIITAGSYPVWVSNANGESNVLNFAVVAVSNY